MKALRRRFAPHLSLINHHTPLTVVKFLSLYVGGLHTSVEADKGEYQQLGLCRTGCTCQSCPQQGSVNWQSSWSQLHGWQKAKIWWTRGWRRQRGPWPALSTSVAICGRRRSHICHVPPVPCNLQGKRGYGLQLYDLKSGPALLITTDTYKEKNGTAECLNLLNEVRRPFAPVVAPSSPCFAAASGTVLRPSIPERGRQSRRRRCRGRGWRRQRRIRCRCCCCGGRRRWSRRQRRWLLQRHAQGGG